MKMFIFLEKNLQKNVFFRSAVSGSKKYSEVATSGYGISHSRCLQMIINRAVNKKNYPRPLRAIDTLDTLKLLNMMYKSYEKNRWVYFNEKNLQTKLGY